MLTKEQYDELVCGLETRKRDNGEEFICRKDGLSEKVEELIRDTAMDINESTHDLDLSYDILDKALNALYDLEYEDVIKEDFDVYEHYDRYASVYNSDLLRYLNTWNEDEIYQCMHGSSISEACAYWFDNQVQETIQSIINAIKEEK